MDPTRTVGATERTRDAGRTDGRTNRQTDWNQYTPPQQLCCVGGIKMVQQFRIYMNSTKLDDKKLWRQYLLVPLTPFFLRILFCRVVFWGGLGGGVGGWLEGGGVCFYTSIIQLWIFDRWLLFKFEPIRYYFLLCTVSLWPSVLA